MIQMDEDLHEILQALGNKRMSEVWALQTIINLVMQNQNMRKTIKVIEKLDPGLREERIHDAKERKYPSISNSAAIRPQEYFDQLNNQGKKPEPPVSLSDDAPF